MARRPRLDDREEGRVLAAARRERRILIAQMAAPIAGSLIHAASVDDDIKKVPEIAIRVAESILEELEL